MDSVKANFIAFGEQSFFAIDTYHSGGQNTNRSLYLPAGGNREGMLINILHSDQEKRLDPEAPAIEGKKEQAEATVQYGGFRLSAGPLAKTIPGQPSRVEDRFPVCPSAMVLARNALLVAGISKTESIPATRGRCWRGVVEAFCVFFPRWMGARCRSKLWTRHLCGTVWPPPRGESIFQAGTGS